MPTAEEYKAAAKRAYDGGDMPAAEHFRKLYTESAVKRPAKAEGFDPANPADVDPTVGMSTLEKLIAGTSEGARSAGRGVQQAIIEGGLGPADGLANLMLNQIPGVRDQRADAVQALRDKVVEHRRLDAPLNDTGAGLTGNIIGNVVPGLVAAYATRGKIPASYLATAAEGAGYGSLMEHASDAERLVNTALTGVLSPVFRGTANVLSRGAKFIPEALRKMKRALPEEALKKLVSGKDSGTAMTAVHDFLTSSHKALKDRFKAAYAANEGNAALPQVQLALTKDALNSMLTPNVTQELKLASSPYIGKILGALDNVANPSSVILSPSGKPIPSTSSFQYSDLTQAIRDVSKTASRLAKAGHEDAQAVNNVKDLLNQELKHWGDIGGNYKGTMPATEAAANKAMTASTLAERDAINTEFKNTLGQWRMPGTALNKAAKPDKMGGVVNPNSNAIDTLVGGQADYTPNIASIEKIIPGFQKTLQDLHLSTLNKPSTSGVLANKISQAPSQLHDAPTMERLNMIAEGLRRRAPNTDITIADAVTFGINPKAGIAKVAAKQAGAGPSARFLYGIEEPNYIAKAASEGYRGTYLSPTLAALLGSK